ncbi:MAG: hypothetical protein ACI9F2_000154 [Lysobacterales bacterium]|jgi:hypothetical protein
MGTFEKSIIGVLVFLFGTWFTLDYYMPVLFYPEVKQIHEVSNILANRSPRNGKSIPVHQGYTDLFVPNEFASQQDHNGHKEVDLSWQALGLDGKKRPANAYFVGFTPFYTDKSWVPLMALSARVQYMRDDVVDVNNDVWQTSVETYFEQWGDCEDHAVFLADWLMELGYDARVVIGTVDAQGHAWVVLYQDDKEYLLEATNKISRRRFPLVKLHPEYQPAFMFNRDHFWGMRTTNRGWRNRLATKDWNLMSYFEERLF